MEGSKLGKINLSFAYMEGRDVDVEFFFYFYFTKIIFFKYISILNKKYIVFDYNLSFIY